MALCFQAVLFDLDGTLLDTGRDMAAALNALLIEHDHTTLDYASVRPQVSNGSAALIQLGFGIGTEAPGFEPLKLRFLELYRQCLARHTRLFDGMDSVLAMVESHRVPWGIVTNKPGWLTEPLLRQLDLTERAAAVVSGDSIAVRKPDPGPLLLACRMIGAEPASTLYIGDAQRDITAGLRAGMTTIAATFGYIPEHEDPADWGAHGSVAKPTDILDWLTGHRRPGEPQGERG